MKKYLLFLVVALIACSCANTAQNFGRANDNKTNATASLKMNETDGAIYKDMYEYLRGRVPALQVDVASKKIRVRGQVVSIEGTEDPLVLVDGVEFTDLTPINPADVSYVDVIKDGTAGIYGAKAAAGVVHIHLKK